MASTTTPTAGSSSLCCVISDTVGEADADTLAKLLKVMADPVRIRIVSMIAGSTTGEVCACDFPEALKRSQPTISHHLSQLVAADILKREKRGKWAWFRLTDRLPEIGRALGGGCCF